MDIDADKLAAIALDAQSRLFSFGGVMLWDMDAAFSNIILSITGPGLGTDFPLVIF